jgi:hypothetical protein
MRSWRFNWVYLVLAIMLFITEVLIAKFAHDDIIRPYVGDTLVVILLYCMVRSFLNFHFFHTAWGVLLFSYVIETLQYFDIVHKLGLENTHWPKVIIGTSFAWMDMIAYTIGFILIVSAEVIFSRKPVLVARSK